MTEKIYELGALISRGVYSYIFELRNEPNLAIKIRDNQTNSFDILYAEMAKSKLLAARGVCVPTIVGIVRVRIPQHIAKTLIRAESRGVPAVNFEPRAGTTVYGLVMQKIQNDNAAIGRERLWLIYSRERERLEKLDVVFSPEDTWDDNIIWDSKANKLYFIDFDELTIDRKYHWLLYAKPWHKKLWDKIRTRFNRAVD